MTDVYYVLKNDPIPLGLLEYIPADEREEITRIKNSVAQSDTVLGRLILRAALMRDHGIMPISALISKSESGKPYLLDHTDIHFSISHTDTCVACAVSTVPVGLDVETVTGKDRSRVASRMFTETEREFIEGDHERFCRIWTMKESFVKMTGEGLARRFADFDVLTGDNTAGAVIESFRIGDAEASVCLLNHDELSIEELTVSDLTKILEKQV